MDTKTKAAQQAPLLAQKSDIRYSCDHRPLKHKESSNQKDLKAKKNYFFIANSENDNQLGQALGQCSKKDFYLYRGGQQS